MNDIILENISILFEDGKISEPALTKALSHCQSCTFGDYKCSTKNRDGSFYDVCVQDEILSLRSDGVHTIASCCGHRKLPASVIVAGIDSQNKMLNKGYIEVNKENYENTLYHEFLLKSKLMYMQKNEVTLNETD